MEIISGSIPLLLSVKSMSLAGITVDLSRKSYTMEGDPTLYELLVSSTGHIYARILPNNESITSLVMLTATPLTEKDITKLHVQFGHCNSDKLKLLLKSANVQPEESKIKTVIEKCENCTRTRKPIPRPVVSLPMASRFNQMVSMDLHKIEDNLYYLHLIDLFSRFSVASVITNKRAETIIQEVLRNWCFIYGFPESFLSDNGGEFDNGQFRSMCEQGNVVVKTTPAGSPWSNGICERHNSVLTDIFLKLRGSKGHESDHIAIFHAAFAKNCLTDVNGFSPYQLVFGRSPNIPSILVNEPPALEDWTSSQHMADHLDKLHKARQAFMQCESSKRIARALKKNIREDEGPFEIGDHVYYKREENVWRGPGKIIGRDGRCFILKHGGVVVKVHSHRLRHYHRVESDDSSTTTSRTEAENGVCRENNVCGPIVNDDDTTAVTDDDNNDQRKFPDTVGDTEDEINNDQQEFLDTGGDTEDEITIDPNSNVDNSKSPNNCIFPKKGDSVTFLAPDEHGNMISHVGTMISRAGKAQGVHKDWVNLRYDKPSHLCGQTGPFHLNPDELEWNTERYGEQIALTASDGDDFYSAKQVELNAWVQNDVYEEVDRENQQAITVRWVCTLKNDGTHKARLVARGFEDPDFETVIRFSPTCSKESMRIAFVAYASSKDWVCGTLDVKTAFLQGTELKRDVFLVPPRESASVGKLWKLKKCVYGLPDGPRHWYDRVKLEFQTLQLIPSVYDPALFIWKNEKHELKGLISVHVDDFWWCGTNHFKKSVVEKLKTVFVISSASSLPLYFLGLHVSQVNERTIKIDQSEYLKQVQPIDTTNIAYENRQTLLCDSMRTKFRQLLGKLHWVSGQTRPDLAFKLSQFSARASKATFEDVLAINKVAKDVSTRATSAKFPNLDNYDDWRLIVYTDSSLANLSDGGTQGGYAIFIENKKSSKSVLISWQSQKIKRVVRSTLSAECMACIEGVDSAFLLQQILNELYNKIIPITVFVDNESVFTNKTVSDKRLRVDLAYLRSFLEQKNVDCLSWIASQYQLADCLTKNAKNAGEILLKSVNHNKLINEINPFH